MKITVSWIKDAATKGDDIFDVPESAGFEVTGGVLIVRAPSSPIAIYAAGCWSKVTRLTDDGLVVPTFDPNKQPRPNQDQQ